MSNAILTAQNLQGNWGTLLLPILANDAIDFSALADELDYMILAGLDGIYSNGTAGEFHNQTETEFDKINTILAEKCRRAGMPFQIGASHPSPIISLERLRRAVALGPSAFQIILPDWVRPSMSEAIIFLQKMAYEASGIPLVLYNPPHGKWVLTPAELLELAENVHSLLGIKVADGNEQWYSQMKPVAEKISVFVPGHHLATGVQKQIAAGAYSNVACLHPTGAQRWWRMMQSHLSEALDIEQRINAFFSEAIVPYQKAGYCNPALDKLLAAVGGWCAVGTKLRWPYKWIPEHEVAGIRLIANKHLPNWFFS